jgi:Cu/Ag efflux pump CusA
MIRRIVGSSLRYRGIVLAAAAAVMVVGVVQLREMPKDVLPEFGQPTVEVQTEALGLSAPEVEQLITVPLEQDLLNGVAFLDTIRSKSVPGLSSIELVFESGTPLARARQVVNERLTQAAGIPNVAKPPQMIQPLSSTARVMMVGLSSKRVSLTDIGVLARWTLRPRLMGVPGVANVSIWGQRERQLQVQVDPKELAARGVSLDQVISTTGNALWWSPLGRLEANTPGSGGFFDGPTQRLGIFHESPIKTSDDLAQVALESNAPDGAAPAADEEQLRLGDVAHVVQDHQPLIGDSVVDNGPALLLVIEKLPEANVVDVTKAVDKALDELAPGLAGVNVDRSTYRPATYVEQSTNNVITAFLVGLALFVLMLLVLFFDWRIALIGAVAVATSVLAAVLVLDLRGETINAMVLAGLSVAVIVLVDDVTTDAENARRRLAQSRAEADDRSAPGVILKALLETRRPLAYATVVTLLALLPTVVLKGEAGEFLPAIAWSYAIAILVSMVFALTVTPVLSALLFARAPSERRPAPVAALLRRGYDRVSRRFLRSARPAYLLFALLVVVGLVTLPFLDRGSSLVPPFRDTTLLVKFDGPPGTSIGEMDRISARASRELQALPGVRDVGAHVGRAVLGDRVVASSSGELWVAIKSSADYDATVASVRDVVAGYPGIYHAVTKYPTDRINVVLHENKRDIRVRIYGADLAVLRDLANEVERVVSRVDGIAGPRVELPAEEATFRVEVKLDAAQSAGVKPGDVRREAATLLSGLDVGALFQDQKIFDVVVWGEPETRANLTNIRDLPIGTPSGDTIRLGDVADVHVAPAESVIRHEDVSRYIDISADVSGRGIGAVAGDVRKQLDQMEFPLEHHAVVLSDYSARSAARLRFLEVLAAVAVGVYLLLQAAFGSWRLATLAFVVLPPALAGGALAVLVDGGIVSIGTVAGFFVVFAIAARGCIVLINRYQDVARESTVPSVDDVVRRATHERLLPTLATALGASAMLVPVVLFGRTAGYELLHPLAVVVLGGLVTTTAVNLFVVPGLYLRFGPRREPRVIVELPVLDADAGDGNGKVASTTASDV